jgi:hypothetical protein
MSSNISYFKIVPKPFSKEDSSSEQGLNQKLNQGQGLEEQNQGLEGQNQGQGQNQGLEEQNQGQGQNQGLEGQGTSSQQSQEQMQLTEEHKKILQKEDEIIAKISSQSKELVDPETNEEPKTDSLFGKALAFYMVIVKAYFALIFKLGDSGAKMLIETIFPGELAEQIFSENPDIKKIVPAFTKIIQVLENPIFRAKLNDFVTKIKKTLEPQARRLLDSVLQIFLDVGTKNMSKLFSSLAISISAFPPAAVVIDIANLMSAGIHTAASALDVAGVSLDSLASMKKSIMSSADDFTQMVDSTLNSVDTLKDPSKLLEKTMTDKITAPLAAATPLATAPLAAATPLATAPLAVVAAAPKKEEPVKPLAKKGGGTIKNLRNQTSRILKSIFDFNQTNKIKKTRRKNHKKHTRKYK